MDTHLTITRYHTVSRMLIERALFTLNLTWMQINNAYTCSHTLRQSARWPYG